MLEITKDTFETEVTKSDIPVLVDFWASWCGPCMALAPIFEETAKDYEGKVKFAKVSTETERELAQEHGIRSIPCLVLFKDGKEAGRITGMMPKEGLKAELDKLL